MVKYFQTSINLWIAFTEKIYSYILNIFHFSFRLLQSSNSGCVGESLAVRRLSWETTGSCYGKCSLGTVPTWNLQLKEVSCAPGLQVHPAVPCADSDEMEWGQWNLRGRGADYKAALGNSTINVHQCFLFHIPEREMSHGSWLECTPEKYTHGKNRMK